MKFLSLPLLLLIFFMPAAFAQNVIFEWGEFGREEGKFNKIWDIVIDSNDNIFVAELDNNRIQKFSEMGTHDLIIEDGEQFSLSNPHGLAIGLQDHIFVLDNNDHVSIFDNNGNFINSWGENLGLESAHGIEITQNQVFIADTGNHRILQTTIGGDLLREWGTLGSGQGEFQSPSDVAVDSEGNIYVADTSNSRIQKFDSLGEFLKEWPSGNAKSTFPRGILVDSQDRIYVVNNGGHSLVLFDKEGQYLAQWGGNGSKLFNAPVSVALDSDDQIYVTNHGTDSVLVLEPIVIDNIPPEIFLPEQTDFKVDSSLDQMIVEYEIKAIDDVDGEIIPDCNRQTGSFFSVGSTTVRCTATDSSENQSQNSFEVILTYQDTDLDTVPDFRDNCPNTKNADQLDDDNNGIGNACDIQEPEFPLEMLSIPAVGAGAAAAGYKIIKSKGTKPIEPEPQEPKEESTKEPKIEIEIKVGFEN